jgi:hypothetical protein
VPIREIRVKAAGLPEVRVSQGFNPESMMNWCWCLAPKPCITATMENSAFGKMVSPRQKPAAANARN